jgi:hypothetical protein
LLLLLFWIQDRFVCILHGLFDTVWASTVALVNVSLFSTPGRKRAQRTWIFKNFSFAAGDGFCTPQSEHE